MRCHGADDELENDPDGSTPAIRVAAAVRDAPPHPGLCDAYRQCREIARRHYENFPVISFFLPKAELNALAAVYAFARSADDVADEGALPAAERHARLGAMEEKLGKVSSGAPSDNPVFLALCDTLTRFEVPAALLSDLLKAFHMDVDHVQPRLFEDLLTYSRFSANPVGRIVLRVFRYCNDAMDELSDRICTGLQLANFWQDLSVDLPQGRVYLPVDEMEKAGYNDQRLRQYVIDEDFRRMMRRLIDRTEELFEEGKPLLRMVRGSLRLQLGATWLGGRKILELIRKADYDVLHHRPRIHTRHAVSMIPRILFPIS